MKLYNTHMTDMLMLYFTSMIISKYMYCLTYRNLWYWNLKC